LRVPVASKVIDPSEVFRTFEYSLLATGATWTSNPQKNAGRVKDPR